MKKFLMMALALLLISAGEAKAQGFLNKMKQKAQQAIGKMGDFVGNSNDEEDTSFSNLDDNDGKAAIPQGEDIIPKRRTATLQWDGVVTPSKASTAAALMQELPALPTAEQMARSSAEERDAYYAKIKAVTLRCEELMKPAAGCSDAEIQAYREKIEKQICDLFGLTREELARLEDENISDAERERIQEKATRNMLGFDMHDPEIERFSKMSEKEQEAYVRAHPEFVQKMQQIAQRASGASARMSQMTANAQSLENRMGQLVQAHLNFLKKEEQHDYSGIARTYNNKLCKLYDQIFNSSNAAEVDNLYDQADELLYRYRLEAAREFRASLSRRIEHNKKLMAEIEKTLSDAAKNGTIPACAVERNDYNTVIDVANLLEEAYKDLPELNCSPVQQEVVYTLPEGSRFMAWECRGYVDADDLGLEVSKIESGKLGCTIPLLVADDNGYQLLECGKLRRISDAELETVNKRAEARAKHNAAGQKQPPYGQYKSANGKRVVEYDKSGTLVVNGMSYFTPISFSAKADRLEWVQIDDNKIVRCTYRL